MGIDIACILFACTAANHLGLIGKIEGIIGKNIPILNCSKCSTFWFTLVYMVGEMGFSNIPQIPLMFAISFLNAYLAIWAELGMGFIDTLFDKCYETIYRSKDNETTATADEGDPNR